ncbi:MAG: hypothetical protein U9Q83_10035 [Bacteroidota bacterium]|nr:hypothetical protein [Bacteroidota bacterium]
MGLDIVELVLEVEDEFDIYLPDRDMECMATPDDLATYIFDKLKRSDDSKCASQVAFYKLRRLFIENFDSKREDLVPDARLEYLLGNDIRNQWKKLQELLGKKLYPQLALGDSTHRLLLYFILLIGLVVYYFTQSFQNAFASVFVSYIPLYLIASKLFGREIPQRYMKLSSLVKYMGVNAVPSMYATKEKVLERVIEISSFQLGIPIVDIKPNSKYIEDLGAG